MFRYLDNMRNKRDSLLDDCIILIRCKKKYFYSVMNYKNLTIILIFIFILFMKGSRIFV